jgi:hypothetical protein
VLGDTACVPEIVWLPLQEPVALQEVALVEVQLRVVVWPAVMLVGEELIDTVGMFGDAAPPVTLLRTEEVVVPIVFLTE